MLVRPARLRGRRLALLGVKGTSPTATGSLAGSEDPTKRRVAAFGRGLMSGFVVLASLIWPAAVGTDSLCAAEGDRAALVVDTGGSVQSFCVALPDGETSGLGLIALANEQHGLAYKLGFGGEAVCMLAGVGPTSDDCFEEYPNFWGYWRGDGSGGWIWSGTGAGSTVVEDGDVQGWSWGSGSNGDSHPRPPATSFGDVCASAAAEPPPTKKPRTRDDRDPPASRSDESGGSGVRPPPRSALGPSVAAGPGDALDRPRHRRPPAREGRPRQRRDPTRGGADGKVAGVTAFQSPSPTALAGETAGALEPAASSGPPAAGLAALGAAALLGGVGLVIERRRRGFPRSPR